jgi:hypothetical protein
MAVDDVISFANVVGRMCKDVGGGFWCVKFAEGCLRIHESRLTPATGNPPSCVDCMSC